MRKSCRHESKKEKWDGEKMTEWREEDHPRDDIGRFTFSGGGGGNTSSAEDDLQKRADILFDNTEYKPTGITGGAASIV